MSDQEQIHAAQQQIEGVAEEILEGKTSLAAARKAGDQEEVKFLRGLLEQLYKTRVALQEKENLLLQAQQGGEHCSLCHHPPPS